MVEKGKGPSIIALIKSSVQNTGWCLYHCPTQEEPLRVILTSLRNLPMNLRLDVDKPKDAVQIEGERSRLLDKIAIFSVAIKQTVIALLKKGIALFYSKSRKSVWANIDGVQFCIEPC